MEDESLSEEFFNLKQLITGITCCAFVLGVLSPFVYYSFFYFNVFEYMELNEILTHIIREAVMIIAPYMFLLLLFSKFSKTVGAISTIATKPILIRRMFVKIFIILLFLCIAVYLSYEYYTNKISLPMLFYNILLFFLFSLFDLPKKIGTKIEGKFGIKIKSFSYVFILALVITVYFGLSDSLIKADGVKFKHQSKASLIVREKDTIKSTNTYYYIGKTNKFVFFYNEKNKIVTAYPESTIKVYSLKD